MELKLSEKISGADTLQWDGVKVDNPPKWLTTRINCVNLPGQTTVVRVGDTLHVHNVDGAVQNAYPGDYLVDGGERILVIPHHIYNNFFK